MEGTKKKRVCIIGGGPAGLVSLKRVQESAILTGTLFEQKDDVGGVWNYKRGEKKWRRRNCSGAEVEEQEGRDTSEEDVTTMYDDLTCNLPWPLMEFLDFPHKNPPRTFLTQKEVHQYLREYANHFHLWPSIRVNTGVINVRPDPPITPENVGQPLGWLVTTKYYETGVVTTSCFDAVMVCTGKNNYPYYQPPIEGEGKGVFPGLRTFTGRVLHCKHFRTPEEFRDCRVVLIGLGPSSADLTLHLSRTAKAVVVCHKFGGGYGLGILPPNARETKNVRLITKNGVITEEEEVVPCDTIIFCTGYGVKFPFLDSTTIPDLAVIDEKYVPNLYRMTIFTKRPTLAILNLCYRSPEIIIAEAQAKYFVTTLEGPEGPRKFQLPSYPELEAAVKAEETERVAKGVPRRYWLQVGDFGAGAWQYFRDLCQEIGVAEEDCARWPLLENLIRLVFLTRIFAKLALYKGDQFRCVERDTVWEYWCNGGDNEKGEKVTLTLDRVSGTVKTETEQNCDCWI